MEPALVAEHYGSRVHHHWRAVEGQLLVASLPTASGVSVSRIAGAANYGLVVPVPPEDSYALSLELQTYERGKLWLDGKDHKQEQLWESYSAFFDLRSQTEAYLEDPFDFIHFHIPRQHLIDIAVIENIVGFNDLDVHVGRGVNDEIIAHLGAVLLPAIDRQKQANRLFVDHVTSALSVHLLNTYAGKQAPREVLESGLSRWQLRRAQELIDSKLEGDLRIADIAAECGLTPSYFARQFARSTGRMPHRWLLERRVDKAKSLLRGTDLKLSQVALACGFADQSHFTRVFSNLASTTPRRWRNANR